MAFLVDNLIINQSLSTLHKKNYKQCIVCSYLIAGMLYKAKARILKANSS